MFCSIDNFVEYVLFLHCVGKTDDVDACKMSLKLFNYILLHSCTVKKNRKMRGNISLLSIYSTICLSLQLAAAWLTISYSIS